MIVVGSMIGSGIFFGPELVARQLGGAELILLAWLVAGLLSLAGAFVYAELAGLIPESGGQYAFIREAYSKPVAFLNGWTILVAGKSGALAAVVVTFGATVVRLAGHDPFTRPLSVAAIGISLLLALSFVNYLGVKHAGRVQDVSTALKVAALAGVAGLGVLVAGAPPQAPVPVPPSGLFAGFLIALVPPLFAYDGWYNSTQVAEEIRDPQRSVPRSLLLGCSVVIALYLLMNLAYVSVLGPSGLAASTHPSLDAVSRVLGQGGAVAIGLVVLVSTFGTANAVILTGPRITFAMSRDGVFPERFARLNEHATPGASTALQAGVTSALILLAVALQPILGRAIFDLLITYTIFVTFIFIVLAGVALFVLRRRWPERPRPFRVPLYPVLPAIFVAASLAFVVGTVLAQPVESAIGIAITAIGLPVYVLAMRGKAPQPPAGPRPAISYK